LKKQIGAKHIISATIETDAIQGTCTGAGKIQVRLQENETSEQLMMNLVAKGLSVRKSKKKAHKNTGFSAGQHLQVKSPTKLMDAKDAKKANLGTQNPEMFGTRARSPLKA